MDGVGAGDVLKGYCFKSHAADAASPASHGGTLKKWSSKREILAFGGLAHLSRRRKTMARSTLRTAGQVVQNKFDERNDWQPKYIKSGFFPDNSDNKIIKTANAANRLTRMDQESPEAKVEI